MTSEDCQNGLSDWHSLWSHSKYLWPQKTTFWRFERAGKICMHSAHVIFACKKLAGFWILFQHEPVGDFGKLEGGETWQILTKNTYLMRFPEISSEWKSKKSRVSFRKTWCCSHFHSGCPGHWEKVVHVVHTYATWLGKSLKSHLQLPCDVGGAIWRQGLCIVLLNEELFRTPESWKSQGSLVMSLDKQPGWPFSSLNFSSKWAIWLGVELRPANQIMMVMIT